MITPLFSISQTARTLTLSIRAPHSRPKDIQLSVDGPAFHFYTSPYLLHLHFEHPVHLPDPDHAPQHPPHTSYDLDTGLATITLQKRPPYPHFARLDMLSSLLVTRPPDRAPPSIEVLKTATTPAAADADVPTALSPAGLHLPLRELSLGRPPYGFANRYEGLFAVRADDASQIVELPAPDTTPVWRRPSLRKAAEDAKFCPQHYIADFLLQDEYAHVLHHCYAPPDVTKPLSEEFVDTLIKLPKREYLPDINANAAADLAGLLYASLYDERITLGDRCVESAWTISKVCASTAFLEAFRRPRDAVFAAYRRTLAYPLYRNCALAGCVLDDLRALFAVNDVDILRSRLLRILLELRKFFEDDTLLRLHCDLFLIDYSIWIQTVDDAVLRKLKEEIDGISIERHELEWDLDGLEAKARRMENGEEVEEDAGPQLANAPKEQVPQPPCNPSYEPNSSITISALSAYPRPGLEIVPVVTRKLTQEEKAIENASDSYTSSYEYESSSCASSQT